MRATGDAGAEADAGGSARPGDGAWGVQQVASFLMAVAGYHDVEAMLAGAVRRIAAAIDADVCAILSDGKLVAVVGFPDDDVPEDALAEVAAGEADELDVPELGGVPATRVEAKLAVPRTVLVGRRGPRLTRDERALVRAMIQVLELALQLRGAAERERRLREAIEMQAEELREVNEDLARALQVRRDLVSMTSHELRTPLIAMLGFARLLAEGWEDFEPDERDEFLAILVRHGQRMLRLVDDLLTIGHLESDRVEVRREPVSLSTAVGETLRALHARDVGLHPAEEDEVQVDPDHLSQMVTNLVDNARKYGAPPVEVRIATSPTEGRVEVTDVGPGVSDSFAPALFERFSQDSTGLRREGTGVGLGLAIVAGLAERNGGSVSYDRDEGRTRFTLRLPRATGRDRDAAPPR